MATSTLGLHPPLFYTSLAYGLLSIGHTAKGLSQFTHPSTASLPIWLRGASKIGWYEGSVWFVIAGVLNYKWSQTGIVDMADKTVAGLLTTLLFGAGASYWSVNDRPTGGLLFVVGALQAFGARQGLA
ncbi:hypothetical protein BU23DRAFT_594953 [Bimuria novae-zelandiae CBS 107.79]|uniref:Uncharacterized protein n=1 Tax=Bimuria novae-zelandiae CBS 107.79 TaxID=1447943 RepID=A0A6A5VRA3_9PLEO|nr:hypothetical protein BU23DRAFT_594953 [Bimuria novae-zelandiae CBS 107.79]